jgi:hypothetical protein
MTELVDAGRHVLTAAELDVLWSLLGLGPLPVALRLASPGLVGGERLEVRAAGWNALRARGLAGPGGPDPALVQLLRLLALPMRQLELRGRWDRPVRAVAADIPGAGVVAVRQDATVALRPCGALPDALAAVLPPARASPVAPRCGRAQIVALAVDATGVLRRRPGVLTIVDGPNGREVIPPDGRAVPGEDATLRDRIGALLESP